MRTPSIAEIEHEKRGLGWVVRRLLLYVGSAFAVLTVFALFFALSIRLGILDEVNSWFKEGWIGFLAFTGVLFWIIVRQSRRRWSHWTFWLVTAGLLTVPCLALVAILRMYPDWRVIWFWPITVCEAGVFGGILAWLFPERLRRKLRDPEL